MQGEQRATAAFALALAGLVVHLLVLVGIAFLTLLLSSLQFGGTVTVGPWTMAPATGAVLWLTSGSVVVALGFVGVFLMYSADPKTLQRGSILALVVSVVALPTLWGLGLGSLLMLIGAILGLVWEPPAPRPPPAG